MKSISIVIPTYNEEKYIDICIGSVLNFEGIQDLEYEILVIDGRSTDKTRDLIKKIAENNKQIILLDNPNKIQASALNIGIKAAKGDYIMRLDAHSSYPPDYLALLIKAAERTQADNVGGLFITQPGGTNYSARLVQALTTHKFGVGNAGFRIDAAEGKADTVPYGFFKRELFTKIGYFNEKLIRCQDYEYNRRIIKNNGIIWRDPAIRVFYFNQPTLYKFLKKQITLEAPFNPYMWYLAPYTFAYRHGITGIFTMSFLIGLILSFFFTWAKIAFLSVMLLYLCLAVASAIQQAIRYKEPLHILTMPFAFFSYHFLHGTGIWIGIMNLILGTSPVQKMTKNQ
jgi:glycosyltransferase involved in cell wall biosynthesis